VLSYFSFYSTFGAYFSIKPYFIIFFGCYDLSPPSCDYFAPGLLIFFEC